jgi:Protein of unknown function (DUF1552)
MNIVMKKNLSRRAVLRGLGATMALPLLDSMVPAFAGASAATKSPTRLGMFYAPNGTSMPFWLPKSYGANFPMSPILTPLEPFRDNLFVVSHLSNDVAVGDGVGGHARSCAPWLTATHIKKTEGADIRAGVSMDQVAAKHLGRETQLASFELSLDSDESLGACDSGYSCVYTNTLAWRDERTPLPSECDPRAVFERLFGAAESTDPAARMARLAQEKSILDAALESVTGLKRTLGQHDQLRVDQYLASVREAEHRIQTAEAQSKRELPVVEGPGAAPELYQDHCRLLLDLLALSYQIDMTRVSTFMMSKEQTGRSYPEIGVPDGHHPVSHHQNDPAKIEKLAKINTYHMNQFAYFLDKLRNTPDGDGSVFDHSLFVYGSGMSDSNLHFQLDLPTLMVGGAAGTAKGGRHRKYNNTTPIANLWVTVLNKVGVPTEKFGNSTGSIEYLSDV